MTSSPVMLLLLYCSAIAAFSFLGGQLPDRVRMTHTRTQLIMSVVSGLMLGVAFYHLLPHSIALSGNTDGAVWWLMLGLIAMLLLLRSFHFHQHDFSHEEIVQHDHGEAPSNLPHDVPGHTHMHAHGSAVGASPLSWLGIGFGLALHTLIDGVALGAVMRGSEGDAGWIGIGVFLAIALHKPLDAISIVTVMESGGWSKRARSRANLCFALMCPLGALLFYFGVDLVGNSGAAVAAALAFSAGAFICIALSDLLPEVHFHSHDRLKLTLAFLAGITVAYMMGIVEPAGLHGGGH